MHIHQPVVFVGEIHQPANGLNPIIPGRFKMGNATDNGAAALDLEEYGIKEGLPARCVVLQGQSPYEVLLGHLPVMASIRNGRVLVDRQADSNT